jgi:hypothetical protein
VLRKPLDPEKVVEAVQRCLASRKIGSQ